MSRHLLLESNQLTEDFLLVDYVVTVWDYQQPHPALNKDANRILHFFSTIITPLDDNEALALTV